MYFTINRSGLPLNSAESQHFSYSLQHPEIFSSLLMWPLSLLLHCLSGGALGACCLRCAWGQHHENSRSRGEPPLRGPERGSCRPFSLLSGRPGPSVTPLPVSCPGTGAEGPIPALQPFPRECAPAVAPGRTERPRGYSYSLSPPHLLKRILR